MLKPPYTCYQQLFVYNFDSTDIGIIDDPDLIGTWIEDDTAILFFHKDKKQLVQEICDIKKVSLIYEAQLDYQDWEAGVTITSFTVPPLAISPLWEEDKLSSNPSLLPIRMDPSVIFGSGFHPTTRLCLQVITDIFSSMPGKINSVVDLGTGTGLLAIAAAKLGAAKITAFDNNPFACQVARRNVELNKVENKVHVKNIDLRSKLPDTAADLVITNLYKGLLIDLFHNPDFWKGKYHLISGFIPSMEEELLTALPMDRLKMVERRKDATWRLWLLKNKLQE